MEKCNLCLVVIKGSSNVIFEPFNIKVTLCNKCYKEHENMILGEEIDFQVFHNVMKKLVNNLAYF